MTQGHVVSHMSRHHSDVLGLSDPLQHVVELHEASQQKDTNNDKPRVNELQQEIETLKQQLSTTHQQLEDARMFDVG